METLGMVATGRRTGVSGIALFDMVDGMRQPRVLNTRNVMGTFRPDKIGFWCEKGWDGSVMMIGGLMGDGCSTSHHGIGITSAKNASFVRKDRREYDFGDSVHFGDITNAYSLNLWIR